MKKTTAREGRTSRPVEKASALRHLRALVVRTLLVWLLATLAVVLALRWLNPPTGTVIAARRLAATFSTELNAPRRGRWLALEEIDVRLALAVLASEDQRFFLHHGFDLDAIADAWESNRKGGRLRGGSTISQQTAKNLFLWSGRSWLRKGLEAGLTGLIEGLWPKRRILEVYLNLAEFGPGVFGADAAARLLLKADPAHLGRQGAARLAAALPAPKRYDPGIRGARQEARMRRVEARMAELERLGPPAWPLR